MMINNGIPAAAPRRWIWRRFLIAFVALIAILWLGCQFLFQDSGRDGAVAIYESLKPGMSKEGVLRILKNAPRGPLIDMCYCEIDHRFKLFFAFDENNKLSEKFIYEVPANDLHAFLRHGQKIGLPTGPVFRKWP